MGDRQSYQLAGQHRWESPVPSSVPHVMIIVVSGERQIHLDPFWIVP